MLVLILLLASKKVGIVEITTQILLIKNPLLSKISPHAPIPMWRGNFASSRTAIWKTTYIICTE